MLQCPCGLVHLFNSWGIFFLYMDFFYCNILSLNLNCYTRRRCFQGSIRNLADYGSGCGSFLFFVASSRLIRPNSPGKISDNSTNFVMKSRSLSSRAHKFTLRLHSPELEQLSVVLQDTYLFITCINEKCQRQSTVAGIQRQSICITFQCLK